MNNLLKKLYGSLPIIRELQRIDRGVSFLSNQLLNHFRLSETTGLIQALEVLKNGNERYRDPGRLLVHGAQYYSQNYEDGMIAEIFRRIGTTAKTFVEIGVGDGLENNTAALFSTGWSGWWIEGEKSNCDKITTLIGSSPVTRARLKVCHALLSPDNVLTCFSELSVPTEVDLFSLDIDLNTYHIWKSLKEFRPRVIVVEYNAAFPPDVKWIHPYEPSQGWDGSQMFGASLKAFEHLGAEYGYSLVGCDITGINAFFVRNDLVDDKFKGPFTAENHYEPIRYYLLHRWGHSPRIALH